VIFIPLVTLGYILVLISSAVLSFTTKTQPTRRIARITVSVMSGLLILVISGLWLTMTLLFPEPPTLSELQKKFETRRQDLQTIVQMSNEDASYGRIAPDFKERFIEFTNGRVAQEDNSTPHLSPARWKQYRNLYARNGVKLGVNRKKSGDIFIMMDSVGMLNRGHATGYVFCPGNGSEPDSQLPPCTSNKDFEVGGQYPGGDAFAYRKLEEHWFAFDDNSTEGLH
jgi:hypothetical protein